MAKTGSDHRPVLIKLIEPQESYRGCFRFDRRLLDLEGIKDSVTEDLGGLLVTTETKINSFGSVTGRAGFAMDAALIYAKGGFAWSNNKATLSAPAAGVSFSDSHTHTGYTLGGGLEYMFAPNWSAKGEYMFTSVGGETYNFGGLPADSGTIDFHTIKVGVNYHFR